MSKDTDMSRDSLGSLDRLGRIATECAQHSNGLEEAAMDFAQALCDSLSAHYTSLAEKGSDGGSYIFLPRGYLIVKKTRELYQEHTDKRGRTRRLPSGEHEAYYVLFHEWTVGSGKSQEFLRWEFSGDFMSNLSHHGQRHAHSRLEALKLATDIATGWLKEVTEKFKENGDDAARAAAVLRLAKESVNQLVDPKLEPKPAPEPDPPTGS